MPEPHEHPLYPQFREVVARAARRYHDADSKTDCVNSAASELVGLVSAHARPEPQAHAALPDDLRSQGWAVAVHNDYRLNGESHTFWLLTRGDRCVKGEGRTDAEALNAIRLRLASQRLAIAAERVPPQPEGQSLEEVLIRRWTGDTRSRAKYAAPERVPPSPEGEEPVAWLIEWYLDGRFCDRWVRFQPPTEGHLAKPEEYRITPLYASPRFGPESEVHDAFYRLTVAQRDAAWREVEQERKVREGEAREVTRLMNALELAWGIIANASGGDWEKESPDWQEAAARWRDQHWHPALDRNGYPDRAPRAEPRDNPAADALDWLWRDIILARNPNYGDWEYPGMVYRHLLAEFRELKERAEAAERTVEGAGRIHALVSKRFGEVEQRAEAAEKLAARIQARLVPDETCVQLSDEDLLARLDAALNRPVLALARLREIEEVIERVESRAVAADGPVTPTLREMRQEEMDRIYELASQPNPTCPCGGGPGHAPGWCGDYLEALPPTTEKEES